MRHSNQINTQQPSVSDINRYKYSDDPRAWRPSRKEEWIFVQEDEKSLNERKLKEAQAYLMSDEFFAQWDSYCAKLDALGESLGLKAPQAQTKKLSILTNLDLAA